mgnify:CR=1 FL=1
MAKNSEGRITEGRQASPRPKKYVAKRQREQAGKREQHDRVGVAGKREEHLVAHVQHARGLRIDCQDRIARHRGGVDGKRRGRQQRKHKCNERLLGGIVLKPDDAGGVARGCCGEVGILHSPKSLSRKPPQRCLSPLWWFVWWLGVEVDALGAVAVSGEDDERQACDYKRQAQ